MKREGREIRGNGAKEKDERVGIWERLEGREIEKDYRKGEIERYEKEGGQREREMRVYFPI
jgi:hypothetical protein